MRVFVWHFNVDDGTKLRLRQQDLYKKLLVSAKKIKPI